MTWKEKQTIEAVIAYTRIVAGLVFLALLVYMIVAGRFDETLILKVLSGLIGTFHLGVGILKRSANT